MAEYMTYGPLALGSVSVEVLITNAYAIAMEISGPGNAAAFAKAIEDVKTKH